MLTSEFGQELLANIEISQDSVERCADIALGCTRLPDTNTGIRPYAISDIAVTYGLLGDYNQARTVIQEAQEDGRMSRSDTMYAFARLGRNDATARQLARQQAGFMSEQLGIVDFVDPRSVSIAGTDSLVSLVQYGDTTLASLAYKRTKDVGEFRHRISMLDRLYDAGVEEAFEDAIGERVKVSGEDQQYMYSGELIRSAIYKGDFERAMRAIHVLRPVGSRALELAEVVYAGGRAALDEAVVEITPPNTLEEYDSPSRAKWAHLNLGKASSLLFASGEKGYDLVARDHIKRVRSAYVENQKVDILGYLYEGGDKTALNQAKRVISGAKWPSERVHAAFELTRHGFRDTGYLLKQIDSLKMDSNGVKSDTARSLTQLVPLEPKAFGLALEAIDAPTFEKPLIASCLASLAFRGAEQLPK